MCETTNKKATTTTTTKQQRRQWRDNETSVSVCLSDCFRLSLVAPSLAPFVCQLPNCLCLSLSVSLYVSLSLSLTPSLPPSLSICLSQSCLFSQNH